MIMEFNITMLYTGIQHLSCSNLFYVKLVIYLCRCISVTVAFCTFVKCDCTNDSTVAWIITFILVGHSAAGVLRFHL